ncbi:MAG: hypothetical protein ACLVJ6_14850 [Merdibacter sp.]
MTQYIEDSLNVRLEVTHTREADWPNQLAAMMAANDLPDVFILSNVTTELPKLLDSEQILCIDDYLDSATLSTDIPAIQAMFEANRMYSNDGKLYSWGLCLGDWSDGTKPTVGNYIRWDLYELGSRDEQLRRSAGRPGADGRAGADDGSGPADMRWAHGLGRPELGLANIDYFASHSQGFYRSLRDIPSRSTRWIPLRLRKTS